MPDMSNPSADHRRFAPATARNREPILAILRRVLPSRGTVLEIASGSGEHAIFFAEKLPQLTFQPSDPDPAARLSIASWRELSALPNLLPPLELSAAAAEWPVAHADAILNINMVHISPWEAALGLFRGAGRLLAPGSALYMYGPFKIGGVHTAPSNERFDEGLRMQNPQWGVRNLDDVVAAAREHGLHHEETVPMPANNFSVIFRKQ